jgi:hypothetical protein
MESVFCFVDTIEKRRVQISIYWKERKIHGVE